MKSIQRSFIAGEEWLFYKIYTGVSTADKILIQAIKPLTERMKNLGLIDSWFFIRYEDPKFHLRIRFHLVKPFRISELFDVFNPYLKPLLEDGLIWDIQVCVYKREIERYGMHSMEVSEALFCRESDFITNFLTFMRSNMKDEDSRWLFALLSIDYYLSFFGFDIHMKVNLMERLNYNFLQEYNIHLDKPLRKQISFKYRTKIEKIENALNHRLIDGHNMNSFFQSYKESLLSAYKDLNELKKAGLMNRKIEILIISYLHMLLNRLFQFNNNLNEKMCYHFLLKFYESKIARSETKLSQK